jgi:hypothetical protein
LHFFHALAAMAMRVVLIFAIVILNVVPMVMQVSVVFTVPIPICVQRVFFPCSLLRGQNATTEGSGLRQVHLDAGEVIDFPWRLEVRLLANVSAGCEARKRSRQ